MSLSLTSHACAQEVVTSASISDTTTCSAINETNTNVSKDAAKNILANYFEVSIDDTKYQTNVNLTPDYQYGASSENYIWQINWNSHDEENLTIVELQMIFLS